MTSSEDGGFEVIPAVDVLGGRAVRLHRGRPTEITAEGGDPIALARRFVAEGATRLHVVDLDGAFSGSPTPGLVSGVARAVDVPVQVGGGFRTGQAVSEALGAGADRVLVGTAATSLDLLPELVSAAGERLVVAIDVRGDTVAVEGWTRTGFLDPAGLARRCATAGVSRFLVTSADRDGTLEGPDLRLVSLVLACGRPVVAAGGIGRLSDLVSLRDAGCEAAVVGSALLRDRFTLAAAARATTGPTRPGAPSRGIE